MSAPPFFVQPITPPDANDWPVGEPWPPSNLPEEDGENLESSWHRDAMILLIELIRFLFQGRTDFFVGGNMFIHFSARQVRNLDFRGPDVFLVKGVDGTYQRRYWAIWDEQGRFPNLIIELLSPTTSKADRTNKKDVYERTFRTPEYFLYDPDTEQLDGWRLDTALHYQAIPTNERGWMWSEQLGAWIGTWRGKLPGHVEQQEQVWLRFFNTENELIPNFAEDAARRARQEHDCVVVEEERANKATDRANKEKERADKALAELARLQALLAEREDKPST